MDRQEFNQYITNCFSPPKHFDVLWAMRSPEFEHETLQTPPCQLSPIQIECIFEAPFEQCAYALPRALEILSSTPLDEASRIASSVSSFLTFNAQKVVHFNLLSYPLNTLYLALESHLSTANPVERMPKNPPRFILPFLLREGSIRDTAIDGILMVEEAHSIQHSQSVVARFFSPSFDTVQRACHLLDLAIMTNYYRKEENNKYNLYDFYSSPAVLTIVEDIRILNQAWKLAHQYIQKHFPKIYVNEIIKIIKSTNKRSYQ